MLELWLAGNICSTAQPYSKVTSYIYFYLLFVNYIEHFFFFLVRSPVYALVHNEL